MTRVTPRTWGHDELASDLAGHLAGYSKPMLLWENMQLGPSGSLRPDVYAIEPCYSRFQAHAFEVKVSRSDFMADVTRGKALQYLAYAGSLTFAVPKGLVSLDEIPAGCGLIERGDEAWRYRRKPKVQHVDTLPHEVWMKLVIDGVKRARQAKPVTERLDCSNWWIAREVASRVLGKKIGDLLMRAEQAEEHLQTRIDRAFAEEAEAKRSAVDHANSVRAELDAELARIAEALGTPNETSKWALIGALRERAKPIDDQRANAAAMLRDAAERLEKVGGR